MFGRFLGAKQKRRVIILSCLFLAAVSCGLFAFIKTLSTNAESLENGSRVDENADVTYYLHVKYDGIDREGVESSDDTKINIFSNNILVTDRIPDGMIFQGFEATPDGVIGSALRSDPTVSCGGIVIDDTQEEAVNEGTWDPEHTEYYYHGLHYSEDTRTVNFAVSSLQAGCQLNVGIKVKTPTLDGVARMDFYNHANALERAIDAISNTVHLWMGRDEVATYSVTYQYTGVVPDNAPAVPATENYAHGANVVIAQEPRVSGYSFSGWSVASGNVTITDGEFSMPNNDVVLTGIFTEDTDEAFNVSYVIEGEAPEGYSAPKTRSYRASDVVEMDTMAAGTVIDDYTFDGWDAGTLEVEDNVFEMPSRNVVINGSFDREEYTVSYAYIGDVPANAPALPESRNYHEGDFVEVASKPSLQGYRFDGWSKDDFYMSNEDVVIVGSFINESDLFRPEIGIEITNPKEKFFKGDTVLFDITVTNNNAFIIRNVTLQEMLEGAVLVEGEDYELRSDKIASIESIPAGESIVLKAKFDVTENKDAHFDNTVVIVSAFADEHIFDAEGCEATVGFDTVKNLPIPVLDIDNPETRDAIGKTAIVIVVCGAIVFGVIILNKKLDLRGKKFARNGSIAALAIVAVASGTVMIFQKAFADVDNTAIYESDRADFDSGDQGAWKITGTAEMTGPNTANVHYKIESNTKRGQNPRDVLIVFGDGCESRASVDNDAYVEHGNYYRQIVDWAVDDILGANESNRIGVISYTRENEAFGVEFGRNAEDIRAAVAPIPDLAPYQCNDTHYRIEKNSEPSLKKAEDYLEGYQSEEGRDLAIVYLSEDYYWLDGTMVKFVDGQMYFGSDWEGNYRLQNRLNKLEYDILKAKYPNLTINTVGIGKGGVVEPIRQSIVESVGEYREQASDNFYRIKMYNPTAIFQAYLVLLDGEHLPTYNLYDSSYAFEPFTVTQTLDDRYFELLNPERQSVIVSGDNSNTFTWKIFQGVRSGVTNYYSVNVKFKDGYAPRDDDTYPIFKKTQINTSIKNAQYEDRTDDESVTSTDTPYVKNKYLVTYNYNLPEGCELPAGYVESEKVNVFTTVEYPESLQCSGWHFDKFEAFNDGELINYGSSSFRMPESDVVVAPKWKKLSISKSMDGTIFSGASTKLKTGSELRTQMNTMSSNMLASIYRADSKPSYIADDDPYYIVSAEGEIPVYMWRDAPKGNWPEAYMGKCYNIYGELTNGCATLYYYTEAKTIYLNEDSSNMFNGMRYLQDITGLRDFDASKVENFSYFMQGAWAIKDISPLATWHTPNLTNVEGMFHTAYNLKSANGLQNFDTSNVTSLKYLFAYAGQNLRDGDTDLDALKDWNVSNVTTMNWTFYGTHKFNTNALSKWNTESLTDLEQAFYGAGIEEVDGLANWDIDGVTSLFSTFGNSDIKNAGGLANWDVKNVTDMQGTFRGTALEDVDGLASWKTNSLTNLSATFAETSSLQNVDGLAGWDVSKVTSANLLFGESGIENVDGLLEWKLNSLSYLNSTFYGAANLKNLNGLRKWDMSEKTGLDYTFSGTTSLSDISGIANWDTSNFTGIRVAFKDSGVSSFADLATKQVTTDDGSYTAWDVSNVTNMESFASGTSNLQNLTGLENWNVSNVKNIGGAFQNSGIKNVDALALWQLTKVTSPSALFAGSSIENVNGLSNWPTSSFTSLTRTFQDTASLTNIAGLENWNVSNVTSLSNTFMNSGITSVEKLHDWSPTLNGSALDSTFEGAKLTSLKGIEKFNIQGATALVRTFAAIPTLTTLGGTEDGVDYGLKAWSANTGNIKKYTSVFNGDSGLEDVTAVSGWTVNGPITTDNKNFNGVPTTAVGYSQIPGLMK